MCCPQTLFHPRHGDTKPAAFRRTECPSDLRTRALLSRESTDGGATPDTNHSADAASVTQTGPAIPFAPPELTTSIPTTRLPYR